MAYNNYNSGGQGFSQGGSRGYGFSPRNSGYNNGGGGYNRGFNRNNFNNRPQKKHSGCKEGYAHGDQSRPYVRGWKYDKTHGLRAFIASRNKKTKTVTSKNGKTWENWTVKVTGKFGVQLHNCLFSPDTKTVFIQDLGLMMRYKAPNGGYVGPFYRKK